MSDELPAERFHHWGAEETARGVSAVVAGVVGLSVTAIVKSEVLTWLEVLYIATTVAALVTMSGFIALWRWERKARRVRGAVIEPARRAAVRTLAATVPPLIAAMSIAIVLGRGVPIGAGVLGFGIAFLILRGRIAVIERRSSVIFARGRSRRIASWGPCIVVIPHSDPTHVRPADG